MKIAITIVVIFCFSAIEGVDRAEFVYGRLWPQLIKDAVEENEKLITCIREAGFKLADIEKRVRVAANRFDKRLVHVQDLSDINECFYPKTVEEIRIKWKEYYVDPECLKKKVPALGEEAMAKKLQKTVNDINRTIISFHKEAKKRAGKRDPVIAMIKCFAYISKDNNLQLINNQKKCVKDESASASLKEIDVLSARGELKMKLARFPLTEAINDAISDCSISIAEADVKFTEDEKHYDVACLSKIAGFEDYGEKYHKEIVKYHLELLRVAGGVKSIATKLRSCYLMDEGEELEE